MIESEFAAKAAQAHALLGELAAAVTADLSGVLATEVLPEVLGAVRQGELLTCRLIERADRTGAFALDGAASTSQYVKNISGESGAWAGRRVKLGRVLADRMPMTGKAWNAGDLGIDHAQVIATTIRELDYDLALDMEGFLAEHAAGLTVEQLKTVAAELLAAAAPETSDAEAAKKRAAGRSPSETTPTAPPGSTHPTADHPYAANAAHCSDPPPTDPDAHELRGQRLGAREVGEAALVALRHP